MEDEHIEEKRGELEAEAEEEHVGTLGQRGVGPVVGGGDDAACDLSQEGEDVGGGENDSQKLGAEGEEFLLVGLGVCLC